MRCSFVPPYLLRRIADADPDLAAGPGPERTLALDEAIRTGRVVVVSTGSIQRSTSSTGDAGSADEAIAVPGTWSVHTADNLEVLPGRAVRSTGDPVSGDVAVDEAATGIEASLALTADLGRASYDGRGAAVSATVHYGRRYDNAFWDGTQLVFGDGDGRVFERFTKSVDVLGHEFMHAVTQYSAGLAYRDQPGALNESVSDVFASCLKQRLLGQAASEADWLIGVQLFRPGVQARGLRDMAAPGTAYDDPVLGRDPQVGHVDDFIRTEDDNGGVHLNSGIPNRAFHLAATAIGGTSWEGAGRVWWAALTGGSVRPATDFAGFAAITVAAAGRHRAAIGAAWAEVGVTGSGAAPVEGGTEVAATAREEAVVVRRSGGFVGRTIQGRCALVPGDPVADEALQLLDLIDFAGARGGPPHPDMFVFTFDVPGRPPVTVPQQHLTAELQRLADLVLGRAESPTTW